MFNWVNPNIWLAFNTENILLRDLGKLTTISALVAVVIVVAFNSHDPSSNPDKVPFIFCENMFEKN